MPIKFFLMMMEFLLVIFAAAVRVINIIKLRYPSIILFYDRMSSFMQE